jgi:hypothetical protein
VGLDGVLLTRLPSSLVSFGGPYSGDDEFGTAWSDPTLDLDHPKLGPGGRPVRAAPQSLGAVDRPGHPALGVAPEPVVQALVGDAVVVGPSVRVPCPSSTSFTASQLCSTTPAAPARSRPPHTAS